MQLYLQNYRQLYYIYLIIQTNLIMNMLPFGNILQLMVYFLIKYKSLLLFRRFQHIYLNSNKNTLHWFQLSLKFVYIFLKLNVFFKFPVAFCNILQNYNIIQALFSIVLDIYLINFFKKFFCFRVFRFSVVNLCQFYH